MVAQHARHHFLCNFSTEGHSGNMVPVFATTVMLFTQHNPQYISVLMLSIDLWFEHGITRRFDQSF